MGINEQISVYDLYLNELKKMAEHLNQYFENNDLFLKNIGQVHLFRSIIKNLIFLRDNFESIPFTAFATLSRMLIDHYSAFFLITSFSNKNEQNLRYYLLMLGSLEGRVKTMTEFEKSLKNLPEEVIKRNQEAIKLDKDSINIFIQKIEKKNLNKIVNNKHITNRNWKFPNSIPASNKNYYNWQELYIIAKIPSNFSKVIQKHFSEFTHGLGLTILYTDNNVESKISIIALLSVIESLVGKIIIKEYSKELKDLSLNEQFIYNCNLNWENWK